MAPFEMAAQMLPWRLRTFGRGLLFQGYNFHEYHVPSIFTILSLYYHQPVNGIHAI